MTDRLDRLERLGRLRDQGLLTDEEFAREKALLLAGKEASSAPTADAATPTSTQPSDSHIDQANKASPEAAAPFVETPQNAVADDLTSNLRPIKGVADASQQVGRVWATAALLIAGEFVSEVGRVNQSLAGRSWTSTVSMGDELLTSAVSLTVTTVVAGLLSLWIARRASRIGVVILAVMSVSAVVWPFITPEPMKLVAKLGSGGLAALALWYLIGVARGAFWLAGRQPVGGQRAPAEATNWTDAWAPGRTASAPVRKTIGWIALGWLGLFLIGGVWFWWSTRDTELAARPMVTPAANAPMPAAPNVATAAPVGELIPMQSPQAILGVWVDEGGGCASDAAFELEEGGRLLAFGVQGSWLLSAGSLTMKTQEVDMDTEQPVGPPYEYTGVVQLVGPNEFHLTGNGPVQRYRRCKADGTEPW